MKPCRWVSGTLETPVKSGPTSGPLIVSSQVIQLPHGIGPPEQFICVPFRLVKLLTTSPVRLTSTVVVPPCAIGSYACVASPNACPGALTSWLRTSRTLPSRQPNAAMPSCRPGRTVPSSSTTGNSVSWKDRYWKPAGNHSRTAPSRRSGIGPSSPRRSRPGSAAADRATNPWNGPPRIAPPAATAAPRRKVRRSTLTMAHLQGRIYPFWQALPSQR